MGWIIAGIIFIIILVLLLGKVQVTADYSEDFILKIKYMFFPILTLPSAKPKKEKKPKKPKKPKEEKAEDEKEKKPKKKISLTLDDILALAKMALNSIGKPLRKILKRVEISHLSLDIVCGGEDAAKAAITFGAVNMAIGNLLGWFDTIFTLKPVDKLAVNVDFESEETTADAYVEVKLTVAAAFAFAFTLIGRVIKNYITGKDVRTAIKNLV